MAEIERDEVLNTPEYYLVSDGICLQVDAYAYTLSNTVGDVRVDAFGIIGGLVGFRVSKTSQRDRIFQLYGVRN